VTINNQNNTNPLGGINPNIPTTKFALIFHTLKKGTSDV
jgi:hypothetical protein